jgi:hypothetical protein
MTSLPKESEDIKELWLDILCVESIIGIIWLKGFTPTVVYYCQVSVLVKPFIIIISSLSNTTFSQIVDIELSELRMEGSSLFELIHTRINLFVEKVAEEWLQRADIHNEVHKQSYNSDKVKAYLMGEAFPLVYRPMELICLAQKLSKFSPTVILNRNFFANRLNLEYGQVSLSYYNMYISQYFPFPNRPDFHFDGDIIRKYTRDRFVNFMIIFIKWLPDFAVTIAATFFRLKRSAPKDTHAVNIGVEFLQRIFRPDENNDLFWLPSSRIAADTVYHLETAVLDEKSQQNLSEYGVHRLQILSRCIGIAFKRIAGKFRGDDVHVVVPGYEHFTRGLFGLMKFVRYFLGPQESTWLHTQLFKFNTETSYWQSIYQQYNIKILWSMNDMGTSRLAMSQAIENLGGFYTGSHWSNYIMYQVEYQKSYDVYFVWSNHFLKNAIARYPYSSTFVSGYVSDHYFEKHRKSAAELRDQYSGKFIIACNDCGFGHDVSFSARMHFNLYKMFIDILLKNNQVVLFFKPKHKLWFSIIKSQLPELDDWIEQGRIVLFFGELPRKAVPALVGMASDLVVSFGIGTPAAECHFAGTLGFHADLIGRVRSDFGNRGLGKVVFRDLDQFRKTIQHCIDEGTTQRYQDAEGIYKMLDPFQDGRAYLRIGSVLKKLQESLLKGENREQTLQSIKQYYQVSVPSNLEYV